MVVRLNMGLGLRVVFVLVPLLGSWFRDSSGLERNLNYACTKQSGLTVCSFQLHSSVPLYRVSPLCRPLPMPLATSSRSNTPCLEMADSTTSYWMQVQIGFTYLTERKWMSSTLRPASYWE